MKHEEIAYTEKIVPDAYHGTDLETGLLIQGKNEFLPSKGIREFLGAGVYFFEGSEWLAYKWATRKFPGCDVTILRASIRLGKCLDLNAPEYRKIVQNVAKRLEDKGVTAPTDAAVINFIATNIDEFDTIRATYSNPSCGLVFPGSKFLRYSQLMICVRNTKCIFGIKIVFSGRKHNG